MDAMRKAYTEHARLLGDYQNMTVDELANGYCDAIDTGDKSAQDKYFSALILRFWNRVDRIYRKCKNISGIERDDCAMKLAECINVACTYRAWRNPDKKTNAQACINQVIESRGAPAIIYEYNRSKNKINANIVSLDKTINGDDDTESTLLDIIEDTDSTIDRADATYTAENYIQSYINNNKLIEAIILDTIAFNDTEKVTKSRIKRITEDGETVSYTKVDYKFWPHRCVELLAALPEDYTKYFHSKYTVRPDIFDVALDRIRTSPSSRLYKYVKATLADARTTFTV